MGRRDIRDPAVRNLCGPLLRRGKEREGKRKRKDRGRSLLAPPFSREKRAVSSDTPDFV